MSTSFHLSVAKLLLFSGGQRTRKAPSKRDTAGGGGSWALRALAGGGPLPGEAHTHHPIKPRQGRSHLDTQPTSISRARASLTRTRRAASWSGRRAGVWPRAGGRAGERGSRGARGRRAGSGRLTYMEVMFLEMSVMLMLAFPVLFPESCPSRRGKRFPSSGRRQLISVLLQTQFAGQASTEPT